MLANEPMARGHFRHHGDSASGRLRQKGLPLGRRWAAVTSYAALACVGVLLLPPRLALSKHGGFGVASESSTATREASKILAAGGSAVDAAVVAALVSGVVSPTSSGIGGGGFALVYGKGGIEVFDFREQAPAAMTRLAFESRPLSRAQVGHLVGVPGEVKGLYELHQSAGTKPWAELVEVAVSRAKSGFFVEPHLASMLVYAQSKIGQLAGFSQVFYPHGKPAVVGQRLLRPRLARTLEKIRDQGPAGFYEGDVAADVVSAANAHGSPLTLADLKSYAPRKRAALRVDYEGYQVYTMPPPSAGGLMMAQVLKMFPADYLRHLGHGTPAYQHALSEALRAAVADRMRYLGDPDHQNIDVARLLSDGRLEQRRKSIVLDRTHSLPRFGLEEKGTHALVTADRNGNVVSLTTTINHLFGAKIDAPQSGVILNNELDDFTSQAQVAPFGLSETPNRARPTARPVSSMTPTIVLRGGRAVLALGGSGGTAIATNATQTLLAALVFDHAPSRAVAADRIYIPSDRAHVLVEKSTSASHVRDLERRGQIVGKMPFSTTAIQMLRLTDQGVLAAADPRKHGLGRSGN